MKDPLVVSMAARLGRSHEDVERALQAFMGTLLDRLNAGGEADLPGLGTFRLAEETISFSPTKALVSAVDFRYGRGTPAVEEEAPPEVADVEASEPTSPVGETETSVATPDETAEIDSPDDTDWMPPVETVGDVDDALIDELAREALGADQGAVDPYVDAADLPEPAPVDPPQPVVEEPFEEAMSAVDQSQSAARHATPKRSIRGRTAPHRDRGGFDVRWAIIPVILVVAVVAFFLMRPDGADTVESSTAIAADSIQVALADSTAASAEGDTSGPAENTAAEPQAPPPAPESSTFSISDSGYTLIAGSTTRRADAVRTADRLSSLGHPVAVLAYQDGDITRYRIGVGKFDTVGAANRARALIEDRLPDGTWVRRIRP